MGDDAPSRFCPICELKSDAATCPTDGVPTVRADFNRTDAPDDALGRVVAGRFRVNRLLGQGGAGRVYAATQLSIGRGVALKLLLPQHAKDRVHVRRFYREARAATRLEGAHVVRVYDFGVDDETRTPFIAMELIGGATLREVLARDGSFAPRAAAGLGAQIARALVEADAAGIVHRDLKPANIMCTRDAGGLPLLKVMDFGIAKELDRGDTDTLTAQGVAIGTPTYMAPEQVSGGAVGPAADLYSLGCILFELVTGRPPFASEAKAELYVDHLLKPAPALPARVGDGAEGVVPPALSKLVARLLAKAPADRPKRASEVAAELEAISRATPRARRGWVKWIAITIAGGIAIGGIGAAATFIAIDVSDDAPAPVVELPVVEHLIVRGAAATIELHEGEPRAPSIRGNGARVGIDLEAGRLTLSIAPPAGPDDSLVVELWAPRWLTIKISGAVTVTSAGALSADELSLGLSGSAKADLEVSGASLVTSIRGSCEATLRGQVERHEIRAGGASRLDAAALASDETSLAAGGSADVIVRAEERLDARNDGTGEIGYLGSPTEVTATGPGISPL